MSSQMRLSSLCSLKFVEFSVSGRFIVRVMMPSDFSISKCWYEE